MKRQDKRKQLTAVVLAICAVLTAIWFGLISGQQRNLATSMSSKDTASRQYASMKSMLGRASDIEAEMAGKTAVLGELEAGMARGDLYAWAINTIRQFKLDYDMDIPQFSQIDGPKNVDMIPAFPYKQASITFGGTAEFYELGRFISDFENAHPYIRLTNLLLEPATGPSAANAEMLSFRMDMVVLVKPHNS